MTQPDKRLSSQPQRGMKPKTIKAVLRNKIDEWLKSITDDDLRKKCRKEAIVTGGCIASMLMNEEVNDFDIYFRNKDTVKELAIYYVTKFVEKKKEKNEYHGAITVIDEDGRVSIKVSSAGVASDGSAPDYDVGLDDEDGVNLLHSADPGGGAMYSPCFLSTNAISLRGQVQLILRFYGDPATIHSNYDFVHCTNYWESDTDNLALNIDALTAIMSKTLTYRGSKYPFSSIVRTRKFIKRGWTINAGQFLKMAYQISDLDFTDIKVLEEQLTGVDAAYFEEVINLLSKQDSDKIEHTVLIDIIDRIF